MNKDTQRYFIVFLITLGIFATAFWISNYFSSKKVEEIKGIQDKISMDILSSETQYSLLQDVSCKDVTTSVLSKELGNLADKIEYGEQNFGSSDQITELKKYYSLLEIKDYLLMKRISERCGRQFVFVLYFYTTEDNCSECTKQGYALTALREKYPDFRVYSFDYNLDISALKTLISLYDVNDTKLPAMVINGHLVEGYRSMDEIEKILPEIKKLPVESTSQATGTATTSSPSKK